MYVISRVNVKDTPDRWIWIPEASEDFSVASMKKKLSNSVITAAPFVVQWNNWVPKKLNIFMWRAEKKRIPTIDALRQRNVPVEDGSCKLCGDIEETVDHLLNSCQFAAQVWQGVSTWCRIPPIFAFEVRDLCMVHKNLNLVAGKKKVINGVVLTACWCIWKERNEVVFADKKASVAKVLEEIKSLAYLWIKNRSPFTDLSWKDWVGFNL
ncbi:putative reverse transcriptase zinc-binding domain-containing protein [Helianthus annuus]|nr:putative reverse transcriptase zinc-binding domain-containing protein [Helianthus annuus]